jgi:hypothetical protein
MFRDVTISVLSAVAFVVMMHVVAMAAADYPTTMPDPETWFSSVGL